MGKLSQETPPPREGEPMGALWEESQEKHSDLRVTFVDLTKSFGTVSRKDLGKILEKIGCLSKFFTITRQFHNDIR